MNSLPPVMNETMFSKGHSFLKKNSIKALANLHFGFDEIIYKLLIFSKKFGTT